VLSEFGVVALILPVILLAILIYMVRTLEKLGNRALDMLEQRLQHLEEQHATILDKLDQRNNGGGRRGDHRHLAEEAGRLIDEYRRLILLSNDPKDKERYERMIEELRGRM
jgi:hypothetical protein